MSNEEYYIRPFPPITHVYSNGQAERFVQTFKKGIRKGMEEEHADIDVVDTCLAVYRNTAHQTTRESPATRLLGRSLRDPNKAIESQRKQKHDHNRASRLRTPFQLGDGVLVRQPESAPKGYGDRGHCNHSTGGPVLHG